MDTGKFVGLLVFGIVGMLVLMAFVPMITETTSATDTFENEGYFYMQKISAEDTETYTLTYEYDPDATNHYSYTYNGDAIDTSNWPAQLSVTIATNGETWLLRVGLNEYIGLQASGGNLSGGGHNTWKTVVTFTEGTVTVVYTSSTDVTTTKTDTYTDLWIYSPTPTDYVMKKADKPAYMLDNSEYLAMGITSLTAWNSVINITGTVEDFTASIVYPPNLTTTVTNKIIVASEVSGYNDLYSLDKLTFTINDGTTTVDATYSYFIVPASVTAEKTYHPDNTLATVINLLPLIAVIGLFMFLVAEFLYTRYL